MGNGKFYGIFPVEGDNVVYTDTIAIIGQVNKEGIHDKAKLFFDRTEGAKYYFESESQDSSDLIYQGGLSKGVLSKEIGPQKSNVHFSIGIRATDSLYQLRIFEVVKDRKRYLIGKFRHRQRRVFTAIL